MLIYLYYTSSIHVYIYIYTELDDTMRMMSNPKMTLPKVGEWFWGWPAAK